MVQPNQPSVPAVPPLVLAQRNVTYSFDGARQTVGGYAFGRGPLALNNQPAITGLLRPD
jgi:hypothetical protein